MVLKHSLKTLLYVSLFAAFSCAEDEVPKSDLSGVETSQVAEVTMSGVVLRGKVTLPPGEAIIDHGFLLGLKSDLTAAEKISLGGLAKAQSFETRIRHGLFADTTYYVKAFTTTRQRTSFGRVVSFRSAGSLPPVVKDFHPVSGTWGDTVRINGKFLSTNNAKRLVGFGAHESKVIDSNDSIIVCIVPLFVAEASTDVRVTVAGQTAVASRSFQFVSPVVKAFSPKQGTFGDVITITGENFSPVVYDNWVQFNEYAAEVVTATKTSLTVRVPMGVAAKENTVSVTVNERKDEGGGVFTMLAPEIHSFSPTSGLLSTVVTIQGKNFTESFAGNDIVFGNNRGKILRANRDELVVRITQGIYDRRDAAISLTVAGQTVVARETFHIEDPWMEKSTAPGNGIDFGTAFTIGDKGYAGLGGPGSRSFWQYSAEENTWREIATYPGKGRDRATSFVINGKAYVGGGGSDPVREDFYRYDPASDQWIRIADFPFPIREAVGVSRNGKGYVLARHPDEDVSQLWSYDPEADAWQRVNSKSDMRFIADAGFIVNNRLFYFTRHKGSENNQLVEFDFGISDWVVRKKDSNVTDDYATGFSLDGKGYIIAEGMLRAYDPSANAWKTLDGNHPKARQAAIAFVIGGRVYFGFGHQGSGKVRDFWELEM